MSHKSRPGHAICLSKKHVLKNMLHISRKLLNHNRIIYLTSKADVPKPLAWLGDWNELVQIFNCRKKQLQQNRYT